MNDCRPTRGLSFDRRGERENRARRRAPEPVPTMKGRSVLGLPTKVRACLFDLDGVLTKTAAVHAKAWKQMFDAYLEARATPRGETFVPFDAHADYDTYVDGKPRQDLSLIHI